MGAIDDQVSQWMKQVEETGELRSHPLFGKPIDLDDGFDQTPEELRLGYRILKNAGYVPAEVEMLKQASQLRQQAAQATSEDERRALLRRVSDLETQVALTLEAQRDASRR